MINIYVSLKKLQLIKNKVQYTNIGDMFQIRIRELEDALEVEREARIRVSSNLPYILLDKHEYTTHIYITFISNTKCV